jgi:hypothetical protein
VGLGQEHRLPASTRAVTSSTAVSATLRSSASAVRRVMELSTPRALGARGWDHFRMVYVYQEKITPPGPLPARTKAPDVLTLQHTIKSLEQENAWLKEQLARIVRDK